MTAGGSTSGTISYSKQYTYDPADNRTGFTLTRDGTIIQDVAYTYDSLNRLSTVSEAGIQQAEYAYDTNGNRASLTYANGVVERYTYNKANWITGVSNQLGDTVISSFDYTYYASGNQKTKTDHTGKITSYTYDGMGRLTQEAETGGVTVDCTYNAAGNRTGMSVSGTENYNTTYVYDGNNCIRYEVQHNGTTSESVSYSHDGNGNIIGETVSGGGGSTYTYNHFNQLSTANRAGTFTYYAYNAAGIRTGKMTGLIRTAFLLDGGNVAAELENGRVTNNYLRGANLIRWTSGMGTGYYLYNAHGDVVTLTDQTGSFSKSYDYTAFGIESNPDANDENPFRYCGEYFDSETGTYYLRARYYDPSIGRFTQPDSHWNSANRIYGDNPQKINERQDALGTTLYSYRPQISAIVQSGNLYAYCMNNPIAFIDRSGRNAAALQWVPSLSDALPWIIDAATAGMTSLGTAIVSSWNPPVAAIAATVAIGALALVIDQAVAYAAEAEQAKTWVNTKISARSLSSKDLRSNSVYVIVDRSYQQVWYVGITRNFSKRQATHQSGKSAKYPSAEYEMIPVATGMTRNEARALEQALITAYTLEALNNMINSIAPSKWENFTYEFSRANSLISGYFTD